MKPILSTQPRAVRGFTLLELLVVVAIMGVIMAMSVTAFIDIGRGAGIKSTALNLRASLSHARQYAITKRTKTYFVYGNTNWADRITGYYYFAKNGNADGATTNYSIIGTTNFTVDGIAFGTADSPPKIMPLASSQPAIVFDTDGSCVDLKDGAWSTAGNCTRSLVCVEAKRDGSGLRPRGLATTTDVYRLTGRLKGRGWVNE